MHDVRSLASLLWVGRAILVGSVAAMGCWYGPPEDVYRIEHALRRWNSSTVAVAVVHESQRPPRGLATFPNGGVRRVLDATVGLYFGDVRSGHLRLVEEFPIPPHLLHGVAAHIEGWVEDAAYLAISGCAQSECWGDLRTFERFRVFTTGEVEPADSVPEAARPRGESLVRMQGERLYLRIGFDWHVVEASLEPGQERQVVFRLNPERGTLQLEEPYPFSLPSDSGVVPPGAPASWLVVPGQRFGPIGPEFSESRVREWFGQASTSRSEIHIGEGFCAAGLRVYPGRPWEIEIAWSDSTRTRPAFVRTAGNSAKWNSPKGVRVGTTLADLEAMSGEPVDFSGFGWDYGGRVRWEEESGEVLLQLIIDPTSMQRLTELAATDRRVNEISGDRTVRSDHPIVRQLRITVRSLELHWDRVWDSRDCQE